MISQLEHIYLSSFLHDIGKVMQRSDVPVSDQAEALFTSSGPTYDNHPSHHHVKWTEEFFDSFKNTFPIQKSDSFDDSPNQLAFRHHNPATPLQNIIAEADRLASGMERGESHYKKDIHKKTRMIPLSSILTPSKDDKPNQPYSRLNLCSITSRDQSNYPFQEKVENVWLVEDYIKLWESFVTDLESARATSFSSYIATLDALYERYFWSVPSSTIDDIPDNSLYEHSKSVSALSSCLYLYHKENDSLRNESIKNREESKFLLVLCDLSGIQKYIFRIAHFGGSNVSKRLRARSFYLQVLIHIITQKILDSCNVCFLNCIMKAGGNSFLLLPNIKNTHDQLEKTQSEIQNWLQQEFNGEISLNLGYVSLTGLDFSHKQIGEKFDELSLELNRKKLKPLESFIVENNQWNEDRFLYPEAKPKEEASSGVYDLHPKYDETGLGTKLSKSNCLAIYDDPDIGMFNVFDWSFSLSEHANQLKPHAKSLISFQRGIESRYSDLSVPVHYEYFSLHVPIYEDNKYKNLEGDTEHDELYPGQVLTFNSIVKQSTGSQNIAYLKADVDNLGLILKQGLDWKANSGWTLSKKTTISRMMELFFSGRVKHILESDEYPEFDSIYTVFSGGDDLFLVGAWNIIHDFSLVLQKEWQKFTDYNPHLTLSVGITVTRSMTPLWSAAHDAEEALKKAKTTAKNQLCSFNHVMKWDEVYKVFDEVKQLNKWIESKIISTSFIRSLLYYSNMADRYRKYKEIEGLRYLPLMSYNVSRNLNQRDHEPVREWLEKYKNADGDAIQHLGYIANYCLLLNRKQ